MGSCCTVPTEPEAPAPAKDILYMDEGCAWKASGLDLTLVDKSYTSDYCIRIDIQNVEIPYRGASEQPREDLIREMLDVQLVRRYGGEITVVRSDGPLGEASGTFTSVNFRTKRNEDGDHQKIIVCTITNSYGKHARYRLVEQKSYGVERNPNKPILFNFHDPDEGSYAELRISKVLTKDPVKIKAGAGTQDHGCKFDKHFNLYKKVSANINQPLSFSILPKMQELVAEFQWTGRDSKYLREEWEDKDGPSPEGITHVRYDGNGEFYCYGGGSLSALDLYTEHHEGVETMMIECSFPGVDHSIILKENPKAQSVSRAGVNSFVCDYGEIEFCLYIPARARKERKRKRNKQNGDMDERYNTSSEKEMSLVGCELPALPDSNDAGVKTFNAPASSTQTEQPPTTNANEPQTVATATENASLLQRLARGDWGAQRTHMATEVPEQKAAKEHSNATEQQVLHLDPKDSTGPTSPAK